MILFLWRERWSERRERGGEGQKKTPLSADDDDDEVDVLIPTALAPTSEVTQSILSLIFFTLNFACWQVILLTY